MTRPALTALGVVALLAACHAPQQPQQPQAGNASATATAPGDFADRIDALPEGQRGGVFMRAITDAGYSCQKIEQATRHAPISGRPAWEVACDHHNDYVALAIPGDTLQIVPGRPTDAPAPADQRASNRSNS